MFDIQGSGLDSVECAKLANAYKVLMYASNEKEKNQAIKSLYKKKKKKMKLNPLQQQQAAQEINKRLDKVQLSWNNDLKAWHPLALQALNHTSAAALQVPQNKYRNLLETDTHGVNANIVAVLANNLETRTPKEMGLTPEEMIEVYELNQRVADHWEALCAPIREEVIKGIELQSEVPVKKIQTIHTPSN